VRWEIAATAHGRVLVDAFGAAEDVVAAEALGPARRLEDARRVDVLAAHEFRGEPEPLRVGRAGLDAARGELPLVLLDVHHRRQRDLLHVAGALHGHRLPAGGLQGGEQDGDQHGNDADHDEQFDEREGLMEATARTRGGT
jgi:hypothetical protein